jgi:hypothetical protein
MGIPKDVNGNLYRIVSPTLDLLRHDETIEKALGLDSYHHSEIDDELDKFFSDPLNAGACITASLIAPVDPDVVQQEKLASYLKEINAMTERGFNPDFDFSCFFGSYSRPLHPSIPANPAMARKVHQGIKDTIKYHSDSVLEASLSKKLLPKTTRHVMKRDLEFLYADEDHLTQHHLDHLRYQKRARITGGCEMSQKWYMHGVTPRTYYVAGPDAYNSCRFLKGFYNTLCDSLPVTNRRSRVNPGRIHINGLKHALFYDLTSFTSRMATQRYFLEELANYCQGTNVILRDIALGPTDTDLGDLIRGSNVMNTFPQWVAPDLGLEGVHSCAGFLGVIGNIATCTFLHGAVLLQLASVESDCGCAGDDAVIVTDDDDQVFVCVRLLGILQTEKTFSTASDAVYLKRRTFENPRTHYLSQHRYFQLPSFARWFTREHQPQFTETSLSHQERLELCVNSVMGSFNSAARLPHDIAISSRIPGFMQRYYQLLSIPFHGFVPQLSPTQTRQHGAVPSLNYLFATQYMSETIEDHYQGFAYIPDREDKVVSSIKLVTDVKFMVKGSQADVFRLLRMGFLEEEKVPFGTVRVEGDIGLSLLQREFQFGVPDRWYAYVVRHDVPKDMWGGFSVEGVLLDGY